MAKQTWKKAIKTVLGNAQEPMHYKDISEIIVSKGMVETSGATPAATVNSEITKSIKSEGTSSPFSKLGKGYYSIADSNQRNTVNASSTSKEGEEQYDIVSAFGMFWKRDAVEWKRKPDLLGKQLSGSDEVNFCNQLGIYLLYHGREAIYVGRSTDSSLGERLSEHTRDRLSSRWDSFSWFGILPVSDEGTLGSVPANFEAQKIIAALEAILIEALEPRQNRKRGDGLTAVEYIQKLDTKIEKKRALAALSKGLQ